MARVNRFATEDWINVSRGENAIRGRYRLEVHFRTRRLRAVEGLERDDERLAQQKLVFLEAPLPIVRSGMGAKVEGVHKKGDS